MCNFPHAGTFSSSAFLCLCATINSGLCFYVTKRAQSGVLSRTWKFRNKGKIWPRKLTSSQHRHNNKNCCENCRNELNVRQRRRQVTRPRFSFHSEKHEKSSNRASPGIYCSCSEYYHMSASCGAAPKKNSQLNAMYRSPSVIYPVDIKMSDYVKLFRGGWQEAKHEIFPRDFLINETAEQLTTYGRTLN